MKLRCILVKGDCLDVMPSLGASSCDFCFADLPYGVTARNAWDQRLDAAAFLSAMWRVLKLESAAVMSATAAFAASLIGCLGKYFRYDLVWDKTRVSGFLNAYKRPMRRHEWLLVSCRVTPPYFVQRVPAPPAGAQRGQSVVSRTQTACYGNARRPKEYIYTDTRMATSILTMPYPQAERGLHPSQKPLSLLTWMLGAYTLPGQTILDPASGSCTAAVAALASGRQSICVESNTDYFEAGVARVQKAVRDGQLNADMELGAERCAHLTAREARPFRAGR